MSSTATVPGCRSPRASFARHTPRAARNENGPRSTEKTRAAPAAASLETCARLMTGVGAKTTQQSLDDASFDSVAKRTRDADETGARDRATKKKHDANF